VYDLTIDEDAPNFAVQSGTVVHNSTRHNTLEKLYDRGYIESDPPRPTKLAMAVVDAAENYADRVVSEEMTAQLEADMDAIANGEATLADVTDESREMLEEIFENLADSRDEIGDHLRKSLKDDKRLDRAPSAVRTCWFAGVATARTSSAVTATPTARTRCRCPRPGSRSSSKRSARNTA